MGNALLFTACLLGAAVLGGFIGSCCAKKREDQPDHERRIAELEERLDSLADHVMDQEQVLRERLDEHDMLIGETPEDGLLGRVGKLEEAERTHEQDAVIFNGWADDVQDLRKGLEGLQTVNDAEHKELLDAIVAVNNGRGFVGIEHVLDRKEAQ